MLLCSFVAVWVCGYEAMWLWLCVYVAMWLRGYMAACLGGDVAAWQKNSVVGFWKGLQTKKKQPYHMLFYRAGPLRVK